MITRLFGLTQIRNMKQINGFIYSNEGHIGIHLLNPTPALFGLKEFCPLTASFVNEIIMKGVLSLLLYVS